MTWESADAEIVEVADDGTVTAKAPGKAKVAIKENGKSVGEYTFNVSIVPIEQIIFSSDTIEVTDGDTVAVKYTCSRRMQATTASHGHRQMKLS